MKIQYNVLINEAYQIKSFYEKNKTMPMSCKLSNNVILSPYSIAYLFSSYILHKEQNVNLVDVIRYNGGQKLSDMINRQILKKDYLVMLNNFLNYCKENHSVPRYITDPYSKLKVSFELYLYCLSKIIVFLDKNKVLPNYCIFNKADILNNESVTKKDNKSTSESIATNLNKKGCSNPYQSKPYNPKTGCDAMGQNNSYYCAVSAVQKILYKFGIKETQKTLAKWAGTTTAGTSHQGIESAIAYAARKSGVKLSCKWYNFSEIGITKIAETICQKNKDALWHLLYRNKYGHYEKAAEINLKTNSLKILNSLGNKCNNGCYCGYLETRTLQEQQKYVAGISQKSILIVTKED